MKLAATLLAALLCGQNCATGLVGEPAETTSLATKHPAKVADLSALLGTIRAGPTRP